METNPEYNPEITEKEIALLKSPPLFDIEVSSRCNIHCMFCPREKMELMGTGLMALETMVAIADWLPTGASVLLSGLGEPLLNPHLADFVKSLRDRNIGVSLITNGLLLHPKRFEELKEAGICEIQISAQTLDRAHYESEMNGADFDELVKNLNYLCEADMGNVQIRFNSIMELGASEKETILDYCEEHEFVPFLRTKHSRGGSVYSVKANHVGCGIFPSTNFITFKGEVMRCMNDRFGKPIGNIFEDSFQDILDRKSAIILNQDRAEACGLCSDSYRWEILDSMDVHRIKRSTRR
ncbi:radical SAM domain protein [Methanoculleus sp. CAG:1088]|uniref:radical SAM/SPASM domain-containing protein n=1 Tax=Methanomethylophilus alvi TaxID=1291540 RepID=UPI00033A5313|nr:radical SAM domain protein [Methanoculleus sp. CAG:1088]